MAAEEDEEECSLTPPTPMDGVDDDAEDSPATPPVDVVIAVAALESESVGATKDGGMVGAAAVAVGVVVVVVAPVDTSSSSSSSSSDDSPIR